MKKIILFSFFMVILSGCTVSEVIEAERTNLDIATLNISENYLLDIGILMFESGVSEENDPDKTGIYEEIRAAESRYFPYHLKTTLEKTRYWGSVRVIPSRDAITDVIISGEIIRSDGEYAELEISAEDITGKNGSQGNIRFKLDYAHILKEETELMILIKRFLMIFLMI